MYVRMYNNYRLLVSDSLKKRYASKCANKIEGESSMNVLQWKSIFNVVRGFCSNRDTIHASSFRASWHDIFMSPRRRVSPRPRPHQCFIRMRWPPTPRDTLSGFAHKTVTVRRVMSLVSGSRVACWRERTCDQGSATWHGRFPISHGVLTDLILFDWSEKISRLFFLLARK